MRTNWLDLVVAVRGERGDRDAADLLQREIENHELGDVGQRRHDAVERLQPELEQVEREIVGEAVELAIGVAPLAIDERDPVGEGLEHHREFLGQRLVLPIALGAVARLRIRAETVRRRAAFPRSLAAIRANFFGAPQSDKGFGLSSRAVARSFTQFARDLHFAARIYG